MSTTVGTGVEVETPATVEKLVAGGQGLVRRDGEVMLVAGGIPGERILIRAGSRRRGVRVADLVEVVEPSPHRVAPPCSLYGVCGGCQFQHLDYEAQLAHKAHLVHDALTRIGKLPDLALHPVVPSPQPVAYRTHARWTVFVDRARFRLGFNAPRSHRAVEASTCLLVSEDMRRLAEAVVERLAPYRSLPLILRSVELRASPLGAALVIFRGQSNGVKSSMAAKAGRRFLDLFQNIPGVAGMSLELDRDDGDRMPRRSLCWEVGETALWYPFEGLSVRVSRRAFLQANWPVYRTIGRTLLHWAGTLRGNKILELYAGSGALGLCLARHGAFVTLVERNPFAVADARKSADAGHVGRCRFRCETVERFLSSVGPGEYDLVIVDPPRAGLEPPVLDDLKRLGIPRLCYLSCDVATLARDLRRLQDGGYRVHRVQPFDMFPQTAHIETLVELARD